MKCKDCGKEMVWMEYSEVWACPDDCNGDYALKSFFRLGINLSPNPKYKNVIRWKTPKEIASDSALKIDESQMEMKE